MWNTELSVSLGIWAENLGSAWSTCENNSWSLRRAPLVRVHCVVWAWQKTSQRARSEKKEILAWVSVFACSSAQRLLSGGGDGACAELVSHLSLTGVIFREWYETLGNSDFWWEQCSEASVSVSSFLSPWHVSSADLAKDHCPTKRKTGDRRTWWSEIPAHTWFFSSLLWFSWAAAAWEPSTGILSAFQSWSGGKSSFSFSVPPSRSLQEDLASQWWLCCAHV